MIPENAKEIIKRAEDRMREGVKFLEEDLKTYRVGKANPSVFNNVTVDYYGTPTQLSMVSSVTAPDARTLMIQPWEKNMIGKIEKAIIDANLGLTPSNNGEVIRCTVPPLTEDRRKELIKKAKATGESTKVGVRNFRREAVDQLKKLLKAESITEDAEKEAEDEVQKLTDRFVKDVDTVISAKEKEILTV